jgi:hypothetical protein
VKAGWATRWLLGLALAGALPARAEELRQVRAVVHVHTDFTTGDLPLDQIVRLARQQGIEAVFLSENYLVRVTYGLYPFRALLSLNREMPSVLGRGAERYFAMVRAAREQNPDVVIVPGVEVIPHYWWSGSLLSGDLTVHDLQRNILVFGLSTPAALAALPAIGSPATAHLSAESLLEALPVGLLVPGLLLLRRRPARRHLTGRIVVVEAQRHWLLGGLLCLVAALTLARGLPFTTDAFTPYRNLGVAPYQELIDAVETQGGAAVWSFPDAFDYGEERVLGLRVARKTDPYGDLLLRTFRYSGFGGVYEDTTRFAELGGGWDLLLGEYARGERSRPAWAIGESGFHGEEEGKWIGAAETIFLVPDRSEQALLDALRRGRVYAVRRTDRTVGPVLEDFTVSSGAQAGISGDTLSVPAGAPVELRARVALRGAAGQDVRALLIRNGGVAQVWTGTTPLAIEHRETYDGAPAYLRLEVRGPGQARILSNPVFLRPAGGPGGAR